METKEYDYSLRLIADEVMIINMQGDWNDVMDTAKYYSQYCRAISFHDRNGFEILTLATEQLNNEQLTIKHEQ